MKCTPEVKAMCTRCPLKSVEDVVSFLSSQEATFLCIDLRKNDMFDKESCDLMDRLYHEESRINAKYLELGGNYLTDISLMRAQKACDFGLE